MQCKSRSPALAEGHLRLWGAGHTAGSRYRRVPSAKTEEAQDSLLGAAGAGDTSSPGPGPAAPASGLGSRRRPPARKGRRVPGLRRRPRDSWRVPVRAAAPRPSHPLTPPHTQPLAPPLSHSRRHAHSPSRRASGFHTHSPQARSAEENRGHEVEALTPGRRGAAHLHVPETRRPLESAGRPRERHRKSRL